MATPERPPTIRFLLVTGSVTGNCPHCHRRGPAGKFCYQCCHLDGTLIGNCPDCNDCGQITKKCVECPHGVYEDETPWGTCSTCGGRGEQFQICKKCDVDGREYEYNNFSNTTSRALVPTTRFQHVGGSNIATCPRCHRQGPASKLCYRCCLSEGNIIGFCPDCDECGQIAKKCRDCPYGVYADAEP